MSPPRRIWLTESGTVCLRDEDPLGEEIIREFWCPLNGGYIHEIDADHPGTLGRQVCDGLCHLGVTMRATRETLLDVIRREYRSIQDRKRRHGY